MTTTTVNAHFKALLTLREAEGLAASFGASEQDAALCAALAVGAERGDFLARAEKARKGRVAAQKLVEKARRRASETLAAAMGVAVTPKVKAPPPPLVLVEDDFAKAAKAFRRAVK
jgi:hypothetical protein